MYINSPGGVVTAGMAIYDTMQYIKCPVSTLAVGQAASMASLLVAAGAPGQRRSLPHSRIMLHQPSGGAQVSTFFLGSGRAAMESVRHRKTRDSSSLGTRATAVSLLTSLGAPRVKPATLPSTPRRS